MRRHHTALLLILGAFAGACSDSNPTAALPSAPTPVAAPPPIGIAVSGKVYDTASRPLAGAAVEVINGPSAGLRTTTIADGGFNLVGQFDADTQFRATKDGHEPGVRNLTAYCAPCNPHHWVYFALALPVAPANIAGDYTLTITADPSCTTLPGHARRRVYSTQIAAFHSQPTPANTSFLGRVGGSTIVGEGVWEGLWFNVAADYVELGMGDLHGQPGLVEQTDTNAYFAIGGLGTTTLGASGAATIAMSFEGEITHCELKAGVAPLDADRRFSCGTDRAIARTVCTARNHQLVFTRR